MVQLYIRFVTCGELLEAGYNCPQRASTPLHRSADMQVKGATASPVFLFFQIVLQKMLVVFVVRKPVAILVQIAVAIAIATIVSRICLLRAILRARDGALLDLCDFILLRQNRYASPGIGFPVRLEIGRAHV